MFRTTAFTAVLFTGLVCGLTAPIDAQSPPPAMNYQGILQDAEGNPIVGLKTLQFRVHDLAEGGNVVWGPQTLAAPVVDGRFNVILTNEDVAAGGEPVTAAFSGAASAARFFSVSIDGTEKGPRQQVLGVPWAHNTVRSVVADQADIATAVATGSIVDESILDGSLTGKEFADKSIGLEKLQVGDLRFSPIGISSGRWSPSLANQDVPIPGLALTGVRLSGKGRPVLVGLRRTPGYRPATSNYDIGMYHYQDEVGVEFTIFTTDGPSSARVQSSQSLGFYSGAGGGPDHQTIPLTSVSFLIFPSPNSETIDVSLNVKSTRPSRLYVYPGIELFAYEL